MMKWMKICLSLLFLVALDQLTKWLTLLHLKGQNPIVIIRDVLELRYIENRGAAFGMLQNKQGLFLLITIFVILAILFYIPRIPEEKKYLWIRICFLFVAAGAVGNMIDRVIRKYVVDMIYFKLIDFPVFNVADIYVTVSMFALVFLLFFYYKEEDIDKIFSLRKKSRQGESHE